MTTNYFYGKFIKEKRDQFNNDNHMFIILKHNEFALENKFFGEDNIKFVTLKSKLFGHLSLVVGDVYKVTALQMGEYMGYPYVKKLNVGKVTSATKVAKLTAFLEEGETGPTEFRELSDSEDEVEEPKKRRRKRKPKDDDSGDEDLEV